MFGIGGFELFIILVFGFLIFGPDKLPEIAKTVGKGIARFREAQQEMNDVLGDEKIIDFDNPDEPFKNPIDALDRIAQRQEEKRGGGASSAKSDADASSAKETAPAQADGAEAKQESFTERKARYERERAARKAAEAKAAAEEKSITSQVVDSGGDPSLSAQDDNPAPAAADASAPAISSAATCHPEPQAKDPREADAAGASDEGGDA